jgi:GH15 family glucan-1,4-alpha-glucosidase
MKNGFNSQVGAFVQSYGSEALDASALRLPIIGLVGAGDPRMLSTLRRIEERLLSNGLVYRYRNVDDGMSGTEKGTFAMCTFWLIDNYVLLGRFSEAEDLFEHVLSFQNDVGLFSEEIDPENGEQLGNFPQAFTHISLINSAARMEAAREGRKPTPHALVEGGTRDAA